MISKTFKKTRTQRLLRKIKLHSSPWQALGHQLLFHVPCTTPMGFSTRLLDLANLHKIFCGVSSVILCCLFCVVALHTYINCQLLSIISYMNPRYVYSCWVMKPKNYAWIQPTQNWGYEKHERE